LVICYTNHALDQFLEDFLDIGIPPDAVVRLGSKSTPRTANLNISEQKSAYRRSQSTWDVINKLKADADELQRCLTDEFESYKSFSVTWKDMLEFLEFSEEDANFYEALNTPEQEDGMTRVDRGGRRVTPHYLFDRWSTGKDAGVFMNEVSEEHQKIWAMDSAARRAYKGRWTHALLQEQVVKISSLVQRFNRCQDRLDEALSERNTSILKEKRIIGCTTTAAAKYARDIRSASPGVVLVEEAGEILESHVLTAMSSQTKRLALIGDHKQLRPKINNYALTVENGDGYDLNRSLFERLILAGYPHTTLTKQHRMCPEISSLVRHLTYPDLLDDTKTLNRPLPRGLQDRVTFFNHDHPEVSATEIADRRDEGAKASKRNVFEAEMVLKIVRYLAQQGYGTGKMVVLTPYLGQLHLLRDLLSKENDPILNDLDSFDLIRAGLLSRASAQLSKRPIRISTIGEYRLPSEVAESTLCYHDPYFGDADDYR
jgi:AAA domain